ncbi:MAG: DUF5615 family PIN-like protein [Rhodospirillales bacterium]|nr:DUF5615 family PIN-like protein [Rhodospirillales bacterium]
MKFLIDECLSPDLAHMARDRRFHESTHVTWLGLTSWKDWNIIRIAVDEDYVLVTNNAADFAKLYGLEELHPGLVCITASPEIMTLELQNRLFGLVLNDIAVDADLVNRVLEINADRDGVAIQRYEWPRSKF